MDHPTYCEKVSSADQRHLECLSEAKAILAKDRASAEQEYQTAHPEDLEANRVYRAAVAAADQNHLAAVAASARIRNQDIDAAWSEHRNSSDHLGWQR